MAEARKEVQKLLPAGGDTPSHFFFTVVAGPTEEKVGAIWLAIEPRGGFVYDLQIFQPFRRRGYAEEGRLLLERVAQEKVAQKFSLHAFGDNPAARHLHAKLGYTETNVVMSKQLAP